MTRHERKAPDASTVKITAPGAMPEIFDIGDRDPSGKSTCPARSVVPCREAREDVLFNQAISGD